MYTNKCTKCGKEFETKNPKRMICPECLYPERATVSTSSGSSVEYQRSYSAGVEAPSSSYRKFDPNRRNSYGNNRPQGGSRGRFGGNNFKKRQPPKAKAPLLSKEQVEKVEKELCKCLKKAGIFIENVD